MIDAIKQLEEWHNACKSRQYKIIGNSGYGASPIIVKLIGNNGEIYACESGYVSKSEYYQLPFIVNKEYDYAAYFVNTAACSRTLYVSKMSDYSERA